MVSSISDTIPDVYPFQSMKVMICVDLGICVYYNLTWYELITLITDLLVSTISDPLSEDLLQKRIFLIYPSRMDMDKDKMAERMLHLTLEILFRLTGEDYTVVKKTSSDRCQDPVSGGWGRPLSPITGPPPHPLIHEDINDQKILELIYKMIELLTGEVPIRCQDVAVYFSMEEWEYLEGHRDLYKNVIMEVPQPLTTPDLSSKRTTPERCPRPLLPQDCNQEDPSAPQDHQGEDLTHINTTETYVRDDERCKEEIPTYDYPGCKNLKASFTEHCAKSGAITLPLEDSELLDGVSCFLSSKAEFNESSIVDLISGRILAIMLSTIEGIFICKSELPGDGKEVETGITASLTEVILEEVMLADSPEGWRCFCPLCKRSQGRICKESKMQMFPRG
ncbi:uncharacterized protein [Dendrobates tinctorius]|uniref:uncharacterized protein n=1 Tax=Dendrobates tinctorius TaxID=92724 RepID=UPI003CC959BA